MAQTQRITMAGRTYTFVPEREPEMDGHDNATIGHLLNSRGAFAGYVVEMTSGPSAGRRLLMGGPSGVSRDAEHEGLAQIVLSPSASVARPTPHRHSASCHGAIGELLCEDAAPLSARR